MHVLETDEIRETGRGLLLLIENLGLVDAFVVDYEDYVRLLVEDHVLGRYAQCDALFEDNPLISKTVECKFSWCINRQIFVLVCLGQDPEVVALDELIFD